MCTDLHSAGYISFWEMNRLDLKGELVCIFNIIVACHHPLDASLFLFTPT